jgi:hypothetical protein
MMLVSVESLKQPAAGEVLGWLDTTSSCVVGIKS